jgi:hypothetical protein
LAVDPAGEQALGSFDFGIAVNSGARVKRQHKNSENS